MEEKEALIRIVRNSFPDAQIAIETTRDDIISVSIVSAAFLNRNAIERHQMVYDALRRHVDFDRVELALTLSSPNVDAFA